MKVLLCAVLFLYLLNLNINSVSALRCYYCNSFTGQKQNCEVKVNNKTITSRNCTTGYNACMTLRINNTISRNCAVSNVCQLYRNSTGFRSCTTCVTDLCNNGSLVLVAPSISLPLGLLTFLFTARKLAIY
ncbi:prostate stem cell antigen-like [Anoplophora glabripennis]|uniref:prostate stem cell antigen-like n=1 Tax=Anoplophora glabripennis TaxID=217634 RepID=UPI000874B702|nr:prostate stem cell antigen-like [Anoplophora glabripennis]